MFTEKPVPGPPLDGSVLRSRPQVPRAPPRKGVEAMLQAVVPKEIPLSMSFARHAERPFPEKMYVALTQQVGGVGVVRYAVWGYTLRVIVLVTCDRYVYTLLLVACAAPHPSLGARASRWR